jgi:hypothetical protein
MANDMVVESCLWAEGPTWLWYSNSSEPQTSLCSARKHIASRGESTNPSVNPCRWKLNLVSEQTWTNHQQHAVRGQVPSQQFSMTVSSGEARHFSTRLHFFFAKTRHHFHNSHLITNRFWSFEGLHENNVTLDFVQQASNWLAAPSLPCDFISRRRLPTWELLI